MKATTFCRRVLAVAIATVAASAMPLTAWSAAAGQSDEPESSSKRESVSRFPREAAQQRQKVKPAEAASPAATAYPNSTRKPPGLRATAKGSATLQKLVDLYQAGKSAELRALADEWIANDEANAYERAFAAQLAAQSSYQAGDAASAEGYAARVVELDALDNEAHFRAMQMLGQLQLQQGKFADAVASLDRLFAESAAQPAELMYYKGAALYRLKRYPEAITTLRAAIDSSDEPKPEWQQMLMAAYSDSGQAADAAKVAEMVAARTPSDKRSQLNLAATYIQSKAHDKAAEVLERLRASGQLTDEGDYTQLYRLYANMDDQEKKTIAVINEGIEKGILKPDHTTYLALAQSYYFTEQLAPAIDAYRKAAPLATDGETYLNLAKALWTADRIPEAKEAARQAKAKGVKNPKDVEQILSLP